MNMNKIVKRFFSLRLQTIIGLFGVLLVRSAENAGQDIAGLDNK